MKALFCCSGVWFNWIVNEVLFFEGPGGDLLFRVLEHEMPLMLERFDFYDSSFSASQNLISD